MIQGINHDVLAGYVANEHIDWTADQGTTNINAANLAGSPTFTSITATAQVTAGALVVDNLTIDQATLSRPPAGATGDIEAGTIRTTTGALALNDTASVFDLVIGNDTVLTTDNQRGVRIVGRGSPNYDLFLDFKTLSGKAITFRCGEGEETGATHTWMSVDPTEGHVFLPTVYANDIGTERDLLINSNGELGYDSSSIEYKENIRDINDSEKIYQLRPIRYDRKDGKAKDQIGLIAEEVAQIFPEFISYKREPIMGTLPASKTIGTIGYELTNIPETVNYRKLVVPLIKAVQELRKDVDKLMVA